jgi:hypothetical protein
MRRDLCSDRQQSTAIASDIQNHSLDILLFQISNRGFEKILGFFSYDGDVDVSYLFAVSSGEYLTGH